jgi:hypothetical protein
MKRIILLNGPPGCGKDTIAEYLVGDHSFTHLKFASGIVDVMRALFNDFESTGYSYESFKQTPIIDGQTGRDLMIEFSEGFVKKRLGNDFWINRTIDEIEESIDHGDSFVISDVGFMNEVWAVRNHFRDYTNWSVQLWRVYRDGHSFNGDSRKYIDAPDVIINNNHKTHSDLYNHIENLLCKN